MDLDISHLTRAVKTGLLRVTILVCHHQARSWGATVSTLRQAERPMRLLGQPRLEGVEGVVLLHQDTGIVGAVVKAVLWSIRLAWDNKKGKK